MKLQIALLAFALPQVILGDLATDFTNAGLTTLLDLVVEAGLVDTLNSVQPFTVFAPINEAFPAATVAALKNDPETLKNILLYHVIPNAAIKSTDLKEDNKVTTANGGPLRVNVYGGHSYTKVTANGKRVIKADVMVGEGSVVHVVKEVLPVVKAEDTIPAVLTADGRFGTLLAAVGAADLAGALSTEDGTFTVFAPTDAAFAKIDPSALQTLLQPDQKQNLANILLKHVTPNVIFSESLCWKTYDTLNPNESLRTQTYRNGVVVVKSNDGYARVEDADIIASNGVIHAIDTVI